MATMLDHKTLHIFSSHWYIRLILKGTMQLASLTRYRLPSENLSKVLQALINPPFECFKLSESRVSFSEDIFLFLAGMTSAKRVSKLRALLARRSWLRRHLMLPEYTSVPQLLWHDVEVD